MKMSIQQIVIATVMCAALSSANATNRDSPAQPATASGASASVPATANTSSSEATFALAMAQYKQGRWSDAYGRFSALADHDHVEASRIVLVMLRHGPEMYGTNWGASQPQIDRWMKLAVQPINSLKSESGD